MSRPVRPFLGESAESRVLARRKQLLAPALQRMAEGTWTTCSIAQLCESAGLNKRYFYESFSSLDALEQAVVNDLTDELLRSGWEAVIDAQKAGMDTPALARHVLKACILWLLEDERRATVLFRTLGNTPGARAHRDQVIQRLADVLSNFGISYHKPRKPAVTITPKHQHLATLGASFLIGGTIESILMWLDGKIGLSQDEFIDDIAQFWVSLGESAVDIGSR